MDVITVMSELNASKKEYQHFAILITFVFLTIWFGYLKKTIVPKYIMYCALDSYIPFIKEFIVAYYAWFLYMGFGFIYLGLVSKKDFYRLFAFLVSNMVIAYILFMIFPNGQFARPIITQNDIFSRMVKFIYSVDATNNVCPSLHVANAIGVHLALVNCDKLNSRYYLKRTSLVLTVLISLSTVFVKQHSVLDVLAGIALALIVYLCIYQAPKLFRQPYNLYEEEGNN